MESEYIIPVYLPGTFNIVGGENLGDWYWVQDNSNKSFNEETDWGEMGNNATTNNLSGAL